MEPSSTRKITLDELAKHNSRDDAWLALRGKVFDVTSYVSSHPGGISPITKGFGKDATSLFNSVHSYVDFNTILHGKQMGVLENPSASSARVPGAKNGLKGGTMSSQSETNTGGCCMCLGSSKKENKLSFNEDDLKVFVEVYGAKCDADANDWIVSVIDKSALLIKHVLRPPKMWIASYILNQPLIDDQISVTYDHNFQKMSVALMKPEPGVRWKQLGKPCSENDQVIDCRTAPGDLQEGIIIAKDNLTHDVVRFSIELKPSVKLGVPIGFHVKLRIGNVQRRYTPVCYSLTGKEPPKAENGGQVIHLIMKVYEAGEFTSLIHKLPVGENSGKLLIGDVGGSFDPQFFTDMGTLIYFAGGSGITPFMRILEAFIHNKHIAKGKTVVLIFFNHSVADIILKTEFAEIASKNPWFTFHPVLTKPNDKWAGVNGRPTVDLVRNQIKYPAVCASTKSKKILICGSSGFNKACEKLVASLPFPTKETFIFEG